MGWLNTDEFTDAEVKPKAVFAVDFDGTIVENEFPNIGRPNIGAIEVLRELTAKGYRLILLTMRSETPLSEAVTYCNSNNIDLWDVNRNPEQASWSKSPKIYANVYIDDTGAGTPLKMGSNNKPCVDWAKLRDLFVQWELLEPIEQIDDGTKTFEIK